MTQTHIPTLFHSDVMHNTVRTRLLITWFASRKCCETISKRTKKTWQKAHLTMTLTEKEKRTTIHPFSELTSHNVKNTSLQACIARNKSDQESVEKQQQEKKKER